MDPSSLHDRDLAAFPPGLEALVRSELAEGEKLVWVGQPRVGRMVLSALPGFAVGVLFSGFALAWMSKASTAPAMFALFGLPFVAVGLLMLASPFWAAYKASRTCYALTDHRALLWEPEAWHGFQVRGYLPDDLRRMWRAERGDGSGDLVFEEITTYRNRGRRRIIRRGFLAIDDARGVDARIRRTFPEVFDAQGRRRFDLESS